MKLLIIEDDATTLDYIVKGFHEKGHSSDSASTGPDGLYLGTVDICSLRSRESPSGDADSRPSLRQACSMCLLHLLKLSIAMSNC